MSDDVSPAICLPLTSPAATLEVAGGKGTSLARMAAAGMPVPAGFHVTTAAYREFVAGNDLESHILDAVALADGDDSASLDSAASLIRRLFDSAALPDRLAAEILASYAALPEASERTGIAVAVRSSATAEDLPGLSFAGQHESYLDVRGGEALLDAVRGCWASLWTARAIAYRDHAGVGHGAIAMAVVVQVMVPAKTAGVLFTADPATGDRGRMVINAAPGLAEALVSGEVTPETYVVDRATGAVASVGPSAGTVAQAALSDEQLSDLAELGVRIEGVFGGVPQDVEWALADDRLWVVQSRPITNLPSPPLVDVSWASPVPGAAWVRRQVVEHMPEPLTPLFEELYLREGLERSIEALLRTMGMPRAISMIVPRPFFATVNGYAYLRGDLHFRWWMPLLLAPVMIRGITRLFRIGVANWRDTALPDYLATIERWRRLEPSSADDAQLLEGVRDLARADASYWFASALAIGAAKVTDAALDGYLDRIASDQSLRSGLFLRGFPSKTLEAGAELEDIAEDFRRSPELRGVLDSTPPGRLLAELEVLPGTEPVLRKLRGYFDRYGHLIYTLDFGEPTQAEDPAPVLSSLRALARRPFRDVRAQQVDGARRREELAEKTARGLGPIRRRIFQQLVRTALRYAPNREDALFYVGAAWPTLRGLALELGRRLSRADMLDAPDDVFYLESAQIEEASRAIVSSRLRPDLAHLACRRRALRESRARLHPPATVPPDYRFRLGPFDLSARESQRHNPAGAQTLLGFAVSPGRVTGPASVILSPADFGAMVPGTVLVCPTTTPAWTPLFAQATGLVTDIGGILAHGSIVAREYGIPAVMGTGIGTKSIADGQIVTVDGNAGTVTVAPKEDASQDHQGGSYGQVR